MNKSDNPSPRCEECGLEDHAGNCPRRVVPDTMPDTECLHGVIGVCQCCQDVIAAGVRIGLYPASVFKQCAVPVDGYANAFYDLASLLKIGAQDKAPREVWYEIMFPRIAKAIIALEESSWKPMDSAPKAGLIDIWTDRRHIDCYYDRICDEWRCITAGHLIRLKDAKYWMHRPSPAEVPAKRSDD